MTVSEKRHDGPVNQASDAVEQVDSSIEVSIGDETPASENKSKSPYLVSGQPVQICVLRLEVANYVCVIKYLENIHLYRTT